MVETKPKYADICQGIARFFQNLDTEVHTDAYQPVQQILKTQEENSNTLIQTWNNRDTKWQKRQKKITINWIHQQRKLWHFGNILEVNDVNKPWHIFQHTSLLNK